MRLFGLALMWSGAVLGAGVAVWWIVETVGAWRRHWQRATRVRLTVAGEVARDIRASRVVPVTELVVPYAEVEGEPPWPVLADENPAGVFAIFDAGPHCLTGPPDDLWLWTGDEPLTPPLLSHPVAALDWREQAAADLSPEALDDLSGEARPDFKVGSFPGEPDSGPGEGDAPGPAPIQMNRLGSPIRQWIGPYDPGHERLPATLAQIEASVTETMTRLWADVHGWAAEPQFTRMPWELVVA